MKTTELNRQKAEEIVGIDVRDYGMCAYCCKIEKCTKDHYYPKKKGYKFVVPACHICQTTKGSKMPRHWISYLEKHPLIDKDRLKVVKENVYKLEEFVRNNPQVL